MEYEHKGIVIAFDEKTAQFSARVAGKMVRSASLASVKKRIDGASAFEAFDGLRGPTWADKGLDANYVPVRIVGIEKPRGRITWNNRAVWIFEGGRTAGSVWKDTPENRKAIDDYFALKNKNSELKDAMREAESDLESKIEHVSPNAP